MQVNRVSFDSSKNNFLSKENNKNLSFGISSSSVVSKAGEAVDTLTKSKVGNKVLDTIQFSGPNMAFPILFATTYGFVLLPRLMQAHKRDKEKTQGAKNVEVNDILRRDVPSIAAVLYAVPLLNKTMAKICEKKSGLILSTNPNRKSQGFWKNVFDTIRPVKGDRVINSLDAKHLYSGIEDYVSLGKPKKDFFKVLADNGANLGKMFKNLKDEKPVLETMYKEAGKAGSIFSASNEDVLEVVGKAFKEDAPAALKKGAQALEKVFKDSDNVFVHQTKFYNSLAGALNLFIITPLLLGILIPKINEKKTQEAEEAAQKISSDTSVLQSSQLQADNQTHITITSPSKQTSLRQIRERTDATFQQFIK